MPHRPRLAAFQQLVDDWSPVLAVLSHETEGEVVITWMGLTENASEGEGTGSRFGLAIKAYADQTGKRLVVEHNGFLLQNVPGFRPTRLPDGSLGAVYEPQSGLSTEGAARICPTCGDPLGGQHGTFCPRCQWTEMDANLDSDPLSNPPDPTRDLHKGIQAARKTSDKLHDFLLNPKSRPDLQDPRHQDFLNHLKAHYHTPQTDPLMPWLAREWKKGHITIPDYEYWPETPGDPNSGRLVHELDRGVLRYRNHGGGEDRLSPMVLNHWADFFHSNHPVRRRLGDIMQHDTSSFENQVRDWDQAMASQAHEEALQGGQVVHTTPDNWTIRRLTTPQECTAEGEAMGHCLGGYGPAVERGDTLIHSLRDPAGRPHATTEIRPKYIEWRGQRVPIEHLDMNAPVDEGEDVGQPIPEGGEIVQIQGKGNREPIDEHKARLADWFRSFPPEERPKHPYDEEGEPLYDADGYTHYEIDHPDLIPRYQEQNGGSLTDRTEPTEDAYGLLRYPSKRPADYDELLRNIHMREVDWSTTRGDPAHIKSIYLLAKERGELPELAEALQHYEADQQEDLEQWLDANYQYAPRYPDPDDPHGWEDEEGNNVDDGQGRPYWEPEGPADIGASRYNDPAEAEAAYDKAYGEWSGQHGGMSTANELYKLINPHYGPHPETGEPGYWNQPAPATPPVQAPQAAPAAPQAFASIIPSHRYAKWFEAVENAP